MNIRKRGRPWFVLKMHGPKRKRSKRMTRETIVSSSYTEQINLGSAASIIAAAKLPFSKESASAVVEVLEAECGQMAQSVSRRAYSELHSAGAEAELLEKRLRESEAALAEADNLARSAPAGGSRINVLIWSLCSLACFAAEFVLTWTALCFVLDVPRMTVLGVLLGLAPPCGLAILEVCLARLFEEPWQRLRSAAASTRRLLTNVAMIALLVGLALGNGFTIVHLAKAREEAIKIQRDVQSDETTPALPATFGQKTIDTAVLWISVCVCVDGSVFLLLALAQSALLRDRRRLNAALDAARADRSRLEKERAAAASRLKNAGEAWSAADEEAALVAERYRAHCRYLIAEKNVAWTEVPIEDMVERAVRLRLCA
jgi:hypothetical protein